MLNAHRDDDYQRSYRVRERCCRDDPRRCMFDPGSLACKPGESADCLTPPQVDAFRKVYGGLKNPRTSEQIFAGMAKGSEVLGDAGIQSWRAYFLDPKEPMRVEALRYFLFHDPNWDWRKVDWERDLAFAEREIPWFAATEKNLTPFASRGGKLILLCRLVRSGGAAGRYCRLL